MRRKTVDERQERELMQVEHVGFWLLFWYFAASIVAQAAVWGPDPQILAGELIGLTLISVTMTVGYIRKGLWDYHTQPTVKTYLLTSLIATVLVLAVIALSWPMPDKTFLLYAVAAAVTFTVTFGVIALLGRLVKRRRKKLEEDQ